MPKEHFERAEFLQNLFDAVPCMLFVVDPDVRMFNLNRAASRVIGSDRNAVLMRRGGEVLHCVHSAETAEGCGRALACKDCVVRNAVSSAFQGKRIFRECAKMALAQGNEIADVQFLITASPLEHAGKSFVLLALEDITDLKEAEAAMQRSEARLRSITEGLGEGVYVLDRDGCLTFVNPEAEKLLGWTAQELLGRKIHDMIHVRNAAGDALPEEDCPVLRTLRTGAVCRIENEFFLRKDGTCFPVSLVSTPLREGGETVGSVAVFRDMTAHREASEQLKRLNELLERQATTDTLTGACNRLKFNELLEREIREIRRYQYPLSLIMFDIDHFKTVNDLYGHHAGDRVLRDLSGTVAGGIREADIFARWGGEEFMVLLPHTDLKNAGQLAEKLRTVIEGRELPGPGRITCSFGVTELAEGDTVESFTGRADWALYRAKAAGRNCVEVMDATAQEPGTWNA